MNCFITKKKKNQSVHIKHPKFLYLITWTLQYYPHYGNSLAWPDSVLPGTPYIIIRIILKPQRVSVASGSSATINQMSDLIWLPGITIPKKKSSPLFNVVSCYCHKSSGLCLFHLAHNLLNCQHDNIHKDKDTFCICRGVCERRETSNWLVIFREKRKYM